MTGGSLYYWDTCMFLAWLNDEARKSGEMDGVREVIGRARKREARIMTSVLTSVEVLSAKIPAGLDVLVIDLLKRVNRVNVDAKVATIAHEIRNFHAPRPQEFAGKTLSTPDAIHLATAIFYRADEFHPFDEKGSGKNLGLIPLSGNVANHRPTICKPEAKHPQLDRRKVT